MLAKYRSCDLIVILINQSRSNERTVKLVGSLRASGVRFSQSITWMRLLHLEICQLPRIFRVEVALNSSWSLEHLAYCF